MKYQPIIDLLSPKEILTLKLTELESLGALWIGKKAELENTGEFQQFIKKMQREWIIETGIIERLFVSVLVAFISILSLALCKKDYPTCLKY
jgi:hypothetical protein